MSFPLSGTRRPLRQLANKSSLPNKLEVGRVYTIYVNKTKQSWKVLLVLATIGSTSGEGYFEQLVKLNQYKIGQAPRCSSHDQFSLG